MLMLVFLALLWSSFIFYHFPSPGIFSFLFFFPTATLVFMLYTEQLTPLGLLLYLIWIIVLLPSIIYTMDLEPSMKKKVKNYYILYLMFIIFIYPVYFVGLYYEYPWDVLRDLPHSWQLDEWIPQWTKNSPMKEDGKFKSPFVKDDLLMLIFSMIMLFLIIVSVSVTTKIPIKK